MARLGLLGSILAAYPPPPGYPPPQYPPPGYPPPGYPPPGYPPPPGAPYGPPAGRSGKVTAAGILNIIGGVLALIIFFVGIVIYFAAVAEAEDQLDEEEVDVGMGGFFAFGVVCFILILIGAIFSIMAGIFALKQRNWGLCLVGSIIGMLFGGGIFSLIALILIAISKDEFYS